MRTSMATKPAMIFGATLLTLLGTGCATKKHVRQVVAPVEARVGSVEKRTAEQAAAIGEVENNVSRVDERAMEADRKAGAAGQAAQAAQQRADGAQLRADSAHQMAEQTRSRLSEVVGNLDNYQHVTTASVFFKLGKYKLTPEMQTQLDEAVAKLQGNSNYVLEIQGYTDTTGSAAKNLELSRKRADEVERYLTTKHNIPLRRIHILGLGEDVPNADNSTREARKQNRRVDINVYARNIGDTTAMNQGSATPPASDGTRGRATESSVPPATQPTTPQPQQ